MNQILLAFAITAAAVIQMPVSPGSGSANDFTIGGIVVDHATQRPLNHVLVEITRVGKGEGDASVLTEADGRFTFLHVPKGKYNLQAQKRGQFPQGFHSDGDNGFATAIVVNGELKTDNLLFALHTDAIINGTVLGDDGEPVANAQLYLFREAVINGEANVVQANGGNTNSAGHFHLGHLEPGKYYLAAHGQLWFNNGHSFDPTGLPASHLVYAVNFYGDTTQANSATPINLAEGSSVSVQIPLHLTPSIRVNVTTSHNQGFMLAVPGPGSNNIQIPVTMVSVDHAGGAHISGGFGSRVPASNDPASLAVVDIPAGRYRVLQNGQDGLPEGDQTVDLTDGSTLSLNHLAASATLSGRIVLDEAQPPGDLILYLSTHDQRGFSAPIAKNGSFKIDQIAPGKFDVNLGSNLLVVTSIEVKGAQILHDRLEIAAGASVNLTVHAQSTESMTKIDGFALQGNVGIAGAMVILLPQDRERTRLIRRDQSDADGSFTLPLVLPGRYTLLAIDDGRNLAYRDENVIKPYLNEGVAITVPLKSADPIRVPLQTRKP